VLEKSRQDQISLPPNNGLQATLLRYAPQRA
jgi:hypothetical protein